MGHAPTSSADGAGIRSLIPTMKANEQDGYRLWAENIIQEDIHPLWHAFDGVYIAGSAEDMTLNPPYDQTTYILGDKVAEDRPVTVYVELPSPKKLLLLTAVPVFFGGSYGWTYPSGIFVYGSNDGVDFSKQLFASAIGYCYVFTNEEGMESAGSFKYYKMVFNPMGARGVALADIKLFGK